MARPTPQPAALKALRGNPGKRPINRKEPKFTPLRETPPCPPEFAGRAQAAWEYYAEMLVRVGVLTEGDIQVLVTLCDAVEVWHECSTDVRANGSVLESEGKLIRNPAGVAKDAAWKTVKECSALLGLDPSSRSKIVVDTAPEVNPFLAITGGKSS